MKFSFGLALAAIVLMPAVAGADGHGNGKKGLYTRAMFSYSIAEDITVFGSRNGGGNISLKGGLGGELALGKTFGAKKNFAVEMEFGTSYFEADSATATSGFGIGTTSIDATGDALVYTGMINAIYSFKVKKVKPYVGIGVGAAYVDVSDASVIDTTETFSVNDFAPAAQALVGLAIPVGKKGFSVDVGYKYRVIGDLADAAGITNTGGNNVKTRYIPTHNILVGLRYNF
jgi:outer membrane protein W